MPIKLFYSFNRPPVEDNCNLIIVFSFQLFSPLIAVSEYYRNSGGGCGVMSAAGLSGMAGAVVSRSGSNVAASNNASTRRRMMAHRNTFNEVHELKPLGMGD